MKHRPNATKGLKALGASAKVNKNRYRYDKPDPSVLEHFPTPKCKGKLNLHIEVSEFSSLCPITGAPDFAKIVIEYTPDKRCVESKSLKIFMMGFRQHGSFHEQIVADICDALVDLLDPFQLIVEGQFTPRGGIPFHPTATYQRLEEGRWVLIPNSPSKPAKVVTSLPVVKKDKPASGNH